MGGEERERAEGLVLSGGNSLLCSGLQDIDATAQRCTEFREQGEHLGVQIVQTRLAADQSQEEVQQTLVESRARGVPSATEAQARLLETSIRARFMVDSIQSLADSHESGEFRERAMQLLAEHRLLTG